MNFESVADNEVYRTTCPSALAFAMVSASSSPAAVVGAALGAVVALVVGVGLEATGVLPPHAADKRPTMPSNAISLR
jgi:hypothetical protein